jgi:hydroxypyruvate reductase
MTPEAQIETWFREVLALLEPSRLTSQATTFRNDPESLVLGEHADRERFDSPIEGEVVVIAIGKAAIGMAAGAQRMFGDRFTRGYVLTVDGPDDSALDERWTVYRASHPIPDQRGIDATRALIEVVEKLRPEDMVVALISGGGSALFEAPREPLTLDDFAELTRMLLDAGAPIQHLNTVRIPLSQVKGGAFRRRSPAGQFVTLMLSDVLGNDPQIIASGPTVEPAVTGAAALAVLDLYGLRETVAPAVRSALNDAAAEANGWDYPADVIEVVGDVEVAIHLAGAASTASGVSTQMIDQLLEGEAAGVARAWVEMLLETAHEVDAVWGGGETTVTVLGSGRGGRNTEFALAAALELDRLENDDWVVASLATDGQDGNSDSSGAIASRATILRARELGLDPNAALANNDSATFFQHVGGLVVTGPSGTNVNDLYVGLRRRAG